MKGVIRSDRGAITPVAVGGIGILVLTTGALAGATGLFVAHRQAAAAADLSALAAARALDCGAASTTAAANGARLTGCSFEGAVVVVVVEVSGPSFAGRTSVLVGTARAGPAS